jgi:radical SAM superfamily enzyme YgiQ (UPF0313 family)
LANDPELLKLVAASGCTTLSFGLESITPSNLVKMKKGWARPERYAPMIRNLHDAGISVATEMIVGMPDDTVDSLRETARFLIQNKVEAPKFYILTPIPGTPYFDEAVRDGLLDNYDPLKATPSRSVIHTANLSAAEIDRVFWELYREVYSVRGIFRRILMTRRLLRHPRRQIFLLAVNLAYRRDIRRGVAPIVI